MIHTKVYAAYHEAVNNAGGRPTVILAKTIKGYGMGASGEGQKRGAPSEKNGREIIEAIPRPFWYSSNR